MKEPPENKNEEFDEDDLDFDESEFDFDDDEFDDEFEEDSEEEKTEESAHQESIHEESIHEKSVHGESPTQLEEAITHLDEPPLETKKKKQVQEKPQKKAVIPSEQASEVFSADEIPLSISIELGRLQMSIKKLMELEPGNLLELGVKPEQNVELTFGGKCIARGELLKIGDTLGVRILEKN